MLARFEAGGIEVNGHNLISTRRKVQPGEYTVWSDSPMVNISQVAVVGVTAMLHQQQYT